MMMADWNRSFLELNVIFPFRRNTALIALGLGLAQQFGPCPAQAGLLVGSFTNLPAGSTVNLTTNGTLDWVHWGTFTEYALDRKAGVLPLIGPYTTTGNGDLVYQFAD